jgi:hypothetical protein
MPRLSSAVPWEMKVPVTNLVSWMFVLCPEESVSGLL